MNPYDTIRKIIETFYKTINYYDTLIIWLHQSYGKTFIQEETISIIVNYDSEDDEIVFEYDWWEGQDNVALLGIKPLSDVNVEHNYDIVILGE